MKKLLYLVFITIFAFSCKERKDDLIYSPINEIDFWVKNHMDLIAKMNRVDVVKFSKNYQRAIFVAKSPEQRFELWNDKYTELLKNKDLNSEQQYSIKELTSLLNIDIFKPDFKDKHKFLAKVNTWAHSAIITNVFKRSEINQILLSLESEINTSKVTNRDGPGGGGGTGEPSCECNEDNPSGFVWNDCAEIKRCKKCDSCFTTSLGCGPMYMSPCDGFCLNQGQNCQ